jgi:hypothetical protein
VEVGLEFFERGKVSFGISGFSLIVSDIIFEFIALLLSFLDRFVRLAEVEPHLLRVQGVVPPVLVDQLLLHYKIGWKGRSCTENAECLLFHFLPHLAICSSFMREFTLMRWTKVLIVPSIILFEPVSQGKLVFNPWFLSSGSILIVAAIDRPLRAVWPAGVTKEIWMLDVLYTAGNITKAAAPFWQNRIHIYSERKVKKFWQ